MSTTNEQVKTSNATILIKNIPKKVKYTTLLHNYMTASYVVWQGFLIGKNFKEPLEMDENRLEFEWEEFDKIIHEKIDQHKTTKKRKQKDKTEKEEIDTKPTEEKSKEKPKEKEQKRTKKQKKEK